MSSSMKNSYLSQSLKQSRKSGSITGELPGRQAEIGTNSCIIKQPSFLSHIIKKKNLPAHQKHTCQEYDKISSPLRVIAPGLRSLLCNL